MYDMDSNGDLEYDEIKPYLLAISSVTGQTEDELKIIFDEIDKNHDEYIQKNEMFDFL